MRCVWRADPIFSLATIGATERDAIALSSGALVLHDYCTGRPTIKIVVVAQYRYALEKIRLGGSRAELRRSLHSFSMSPAKKWIYRRRFNGGDVNLDVSGVCPAAASPLTGCITSGAGYGCTSQPATKPSAVARKFEHQKQQG
jgi:hypothetical protein